MAVYLITEIYLVYGMNVLNKNFVSVGQLIVATLIQVVKLLSTTSASLPFDLACFL